MSECGICCGAAPTRASTGPPMPLMRKRKPFRSSRELISFLNQAPICTPCKAGGDAMNVEPLERRVDDVAAAAEGPPRELLAAVQPERKSGAEAECGDFVEIEVGWGMRALNRAAADRVEGLLAGRQLPRRVRDDLELAVGGLADIAAKHLRRAEHHLHRLGEARGHAPFDVRRGLGNSRSRECRHSKRSCGARPQELSASHGFSPPQTSVFGLA